MRAICLAVASALALSACGGGGDGVSAPAAPSASNASPAPALPPPPTPTATPHTPNSLPSAANATVGLQQRSDFAVYAYFLTFPQGVGNTVTIGFDQARTSTTVTIPGFPSGYLDLLGGPPSTDFAGSVLLPSGGASFMMLRPGAQNSVLALDHASVGWWEDSSVGAISAIETAGAFAYGVPTAAGAFPTTGTTRYRILGFAVYNAITEGHLVGRFRGEIDINFATRTVTGRIAAGDRPGIEPGSNPPAMTLLSGTLTADGRFTGGARAADGTPGSYEGSLAGPQGQEIMLRWTGRFPWQFGGNLTSEHNGAMAGKP